MEHILDKKEWNMESLLNFLHEISQNHNTKWHCNMIHKRKIKNTQELFYNTYPYTFCDNAINEFVCDMIDYLINQEYQGKFLYHYPYADTKADIEYLKSDNPAINQAWTKLYESLINAEPGKEQPNNFNAYCFWGQIDTKQIQLITIRNPISNFKKKFLCTISGANTLTAVKQQEKKICVFCLSYRCYCNR